MVALDVTAPVAVVGAGTMGTGIAQVVAAAGHQVRLIDTDAAAAARAVDTIRTGLARDVERGRLDESAARAAGDRLSATSDEASLAGSRLVIEAIVEDLDVKRALFARLERICGPGAVLASNTSSLSITEIADGLLLPGRIAGLHFFNPAPRLPLVEVISGERTDAAVVDTLVSTVQAWGKTAVRAASTPGFIVNRVARPFYAEAFRLLRGAVDDPATIDALLRESGGFRMGPCELTDLIGQDVNAAVTRSVWEAFGRDPRFEPSDVQQALVEAGHLGRKTGRGWFDTDAGRPEPSTAARVATPASADARPPAPSEIGPYDRGGPLERLRLQGVGHALPDASARVEPTSGWQIVLDDVVLRLTDGRTAAQHTGGGPVTVVLVDLALDFGATSRVGVAAPRHAPRAHVDAAVGFLQDLGLAVTILPDTPGLVVARTVAMLAAFAVDAVDAGVATADDVDTAMRLGVNYPRGPIEWGAALGWDWVAGVLDALAAADDARRYRVSAELRGLAAGVVADAATQEDVAPETDAASGADAPSGTDSAPTFGVETVAGAGVAAAGTGSPPPPDKPDLPDPPTEPPAEPPAEPDPAVVLATRAADAMWLGDAASQALGMSRLDVSPGRARFSMTVRPDMVNGHGICHGGVIFALADTAFAFACNSYNRNAVAQSCDISFVAPAREGDTLIAEASERFRQGRSGIYDVTVVREARPDDTQPDLDAGALDAADEPVGEPATTPAPVADPDRIAGPDSTVGPDSATRTERAAGPERTEHEVVAEFRGRSREISGTLVDAEPA